MVVLTACSGDSGTNTVGENEWVVQRVVIDDKTIDAGDPYAVLDPVWWTGDIDNDVSDYERSLSPFSRRQRLLFAAI